MLLSSLAPFLLLLDTGGTTPTHKRVYNVYYPLRVDVPQSRNVAPFPLPPPPLPLHPQAGAASTTQLKKRQPPAPPLQPPKDWKLPKPPKSQPFVEGPKSKDLWRGEIFRAPEDVRNAGGFDSHAKRIFEGKHPEYHDGMTTEGFKKGSSLHEHGVYKNPYSSYVPTSTSMEAAKNFAKKPGKTGYLYKIRSSPDMVDVSGSLGGSQYYKNAHELEIAGVYDIPWGQVEGWHKIKHNPTTGEYDIGEFVRNSEFAPVKGEGAYLSHHSLAGWPEGHVAWENEWWAPFKDKPVEGMLNEYLLKYRFNDDVEAFNKLRPGKWGRLPCSLSRKRGEGMDVCTLIRSQRPEGEATTKPSEENVPDGVKPGDVTLGEEDLNSAGSRGSGLLFRGQG